MLKQIPKQSRHLAVLIILVSILVFAGTTLVPGRTLASNPIIFGDLTWNSAQVQNRIAGFIIEHGYGYAVKYQYGAAAALFTGLRRGDIDVLMESWTDNRIEVMKEGITGGNYIDLGPSFPNAPQGWYVPTYVIKGDAERGIEPMAPDLRSVKDLKKYVKLFKDPADPNKGRLYSCPSAWACYDINETKLQTYDLDKYYNNFDPGSQAALNTAILSAYQKGEPILAYNWEPTWIMGMLDMTLLEEPKYSEEKWERNYGCAYPFAKVHIVINSPLANDNPEVVSFLTNYHITLEQTNAALAYMHEEEASTEEAALWFLRRYPEEWHNWFPIPGDYAANIIAKVEEALGTK